MWLRPEDKQAEFWGCPSSVSEPQSRTPSSRQEWLLLTPVQAPEYSSLSAFTSFGESTFQNRPAGHEK